MHDEEKDHARMDIKADSIDARTAPTVAPTAHTPGPWTVLGVDDLSGVDPELLDTDALIIANLQAEDRAATVICDLWDLDDGGGEKRGEVEANARLMAVAPDMLTALRALDEFQRVYERNTHDNAPGNEHYSRMLLDVVLLARLAIAKAGGR